MNPHILVADDEPQIRDLLRRQMERCGFRVTEAVNGQDAIDVLDKFDVDVVIADILMPEKDGLEVIMHVQRTHPSVKAIAISAANNRVFLQSARLLGAKETFEKPFRLNELQHAVEQLLSKD